MEEPCYLVITGSSFEMCCAKDCFDRFHTLGAVDKGFAEFPLIDKDISKCWQSPWLSVKAVSLTRFELQRQMKISQFLLNKRDIARLLLRFNDCDAFLEGFCCIFEVAHHPPTASYVEVVQRKCLDLFFGVLQRALSNVDRSLMKFNGFFWIFVSNADAQIHERVCSIWMRGVEHASSHRSFSQIPWLLKQNCSFITMS